MIRFQDEMQIFIILKRFLWTESRNRYIRTEESFSQHFHEILKKTERTTNNKNDFFTIFQLLMLNVSHISSMFTMFTALLSVLPSIVATGGRGGAQSNSITCSGAFL